MAGRSEAWRWMSASRSLALRLRVWSEEPLGEGTVGRVRGLGLVGSRFLRALRAGELDLEEEEARRGSLSRSRSRSEALVGGEEPRGEGLTGELVVRLCERVRVIAVEPELASDWRWEDGLLDEVGVGSFLPAMDDDGVCLVLPSRGFFGSPFSLGLGSIFFASGSLSFGFFTSDLPTSSSLCLFFDSIFFGSSFFSIGLGAGFFEVTVFDATSDSSF